MGSKQKTFKFYFILMNLKRRLKIILEADMQADLENIKKLFEMLKVNAIYLF